MQLMFADRAIAQRAPQHLRWQEGYSGLDGSPRRPPLSWALRMMRGGREEQGFQGGQKGRVPHVQLGRNQEGLGGNTSIYIGLGLVTSQYLLPYLKLWEVL